MAAIDIGEIRKKKRMVVDGLDVVIEDVHEGGNGKVDSVILEIDNCCLVGCKRILGPKGPTVGATWYRFHDKRASGNPQDDALPSRYLNCAAKVGRGIFGIKRLESRRRKIQLSQSQARLI